MEVSGSLKAGFYGAPNTWINGSVTLATPVTGALVIAGRRAPRRVSQFLEGRGVPARDLNVELNILAAVDRELFDRLALTATLADLDARITGLSTARRARWTRSTSLVSMCWLRGWTP